MLNKHISANQNAYGSLLDARELAKIKEEERSCSKDEEDDGVDNSDA
jgi:hypothetical protein